MKNLFAVDWKTAEKLISGSEAVIISIGSIEQHGFHLPLGTDTIINEKILEEVTRDINCVYYPPITFGQTWSSSTYPGTISISEKVLIDYLDCVVNSLMQFNPQKMILYSFHRGNEKAIIDYCRNHEEINNLYHVDFFNIYDYVKDNVEDHKFGKTWHAGEIETSIMMYVDASKVSLEKFDEKKIIDKIDACKVREIKWKSFNDSGSWGNASLATFEKGEIIFNTLVDKIKDSINFIIRYK